VTDRMYTSPQQGYLMCSQCGSSVIDVVKHEDWHQSLEQIHLGLAGLAVMP